MSHAICQKCGASRIVTLLACGACGNHPRTERELAMAMLLSTHYQSEDDLARHAARIRAGDLPVMPPQILLAMRPVIVRMRRLGRRLGLDLPGAQPAAATREKKSASLMMVPSRPATSHSLSHGASDDTSTTREPGMSPRLSRSV